MRLIIWSNSPWSATGYGIQTRAMCDIFRELGHEVAVSANFGLHGNTLDWRGTKVYPRYRAGLGEDVIGVHVKNFGADALLSLYDIWVLPPDLTLPVPWIGMVPVDGEPVSQRMRQVAQNIDYRVAYSKFGHEQLKKAGLSSTYIPHGFDTDVFSPGDKRAARDRFGIPHEAFLVTTVAANKGYPCRKGWPELLEAYAIFHKRHPESLLYLHTTNMPFGSGGDGINVKQYLKFLGVPANAFMMVNEADLALGVPDEHLVQFYRASDVFLLPSMGEGFGMTIPEAQACGCPVIVQDCSATAELCVNGIKLKPLQHMWLPQLGYYWQLPSIPRIVRALGMVYNYEPSPRFWDERREAGIEHIRQNYDWRVIKNYWRTLLDRVEAELW